MKEDKFIEDLNKLVKEKSNQSGKSLVSYYRIIINYCKKRIGENEMLNKKKYKDEKQIFLLWEGKETRFGRVLESKIPKYIELYGEPTKKWVI